MKPIVPALAMLLSTAAYAQNQDVALNSIPNTIVTSYASLPNEVLLGEFNEKSKQSKGLGKDAYYFENSVGESVSLQSFLFKVDRVKHTTKAYVRFYEKKEYLQEVYVDNDTISYPSYIPGDEIDAKEIAVTMKPGQKGIVEVDLSEYNIDMPLGGLFVSLELMGYYDADGKAITGLKSKDLTLIDIHPTTTDNYCGWNVVQGSETGFWINSNKMIKTDFKYAFKKEPSEKILTAPNFGLKVGGK